MIDYVEFPLIQRLNDNEFRKRYIEYISYYNAANDSQFMNKRMLCKKKFKCINDVDYLHKNITYNFLQLLRILNSRLNIRYNLNRINMQHHYFDNRSDLNIVVNYYTNGVDHLIRLVYYRGAVTMPLRDKQKKNLDDKVAITYSKDILDVLFGLYTFEQFIGATGGMMCLIPDILKLVYDYTFMY